MDAAPSRRDHLKPDAGLHNARHFQPGELGALTFSHTVPYGCSVQGGCFGDEVHAGR